MKPRAIERLFAGLTAALLGLVAAASAEAQAPARFEADQRGDTLRIRIVYPEAAGGDLSANARIAAGSVLIAEFSEPLAGDVRSLVEAAPARLAMARLDPDGETLRLALNAALEPRVSVSHNIIAIDLAPPGTDPLPDIVSPYEEAQERARARRAEEARRAAEAARLAELGPVLPVEVNAGEAAEYTRIEFVWPEAVSYTLTREGDTARLAFSRRGEADLAVLRVDPPRLIERVEIDESRERFTLEFDIAPGAEARAWADGERRVVFDVADPNATGAREALQALAAYAETAAPPPSSANSDEPDEAAGRAGEPDAQGDVEIGDASASPAGETQRPAPTPESGVVALETRVDGRDLALTFGWAARPGAAVFRRGQAIWIVFDAPAELDLAELNEAGRRHVRGFDAVSGDGYAALRIEAPDSTQADVRATGAAWTITLTETLAEPPRPVQVSRITRFNEPAAIDIDLPGARRMVVLDDPVVGDRLFVLTADGETRGVIAERRFVEALFLPSAHGVALKPAADDLELTVEENGAHLTRPGGMLLSRSAAPTLTATVAKPTSPGFLDLEAWRGSRPFPEGEQALVRRAESQRAAPLMALARFYLGWGLAPEALGAIDLAVEDRPQLADAPRTRAMRGVASIMLERHDEAEAFFADPRLRQDSAAQPWRGLAAAERGDWAEARRRFAAGEDTLAHFDPAWRARIIGASARAAVETNALGSAEQLLRLLETQEPDDRTHAEARFTEGRLAAALGRTDAALEIFGDLANADWAPIQAPAILEKTRLEIEIGRITTDEGIDALEGLRYRWRGDETELEATRLLANLHAEAGRYEEALALMETARNRFEGRRATRRVGRDMDALFRRLFLDDEADRLPPLEALALWYDYQYLTPQGAEGRRMVRRIADRLVAVDLLDPAAELLAHQVFEPRVTITPQARASVAADLAVVYLLADRPEDALRAIRSTRVAGLEEDLIAERRLLEARALAELGRGEHALELIQTDDSEPARRLRADVAWRARRWADAGRRMEALLGDRWRDDAPLEAYEAQDVLRAMIAYALADDREAMDRVHARFGAAMAETRHASAFSLVAEEAVRAGDARLADMVSSLADVEGVDAFMAGFAQRFDGARDPES